MESDPEQDNQVHHNHKLLIKLKIQGKVNSSSSSSSPSDQQQLVVGASSSHDHNTPIHHITNNTPRVCPQCNKEFGSGKALGGHMRIHAEAIKKQRRQKLLRPNQSVEFKNNEDLSYHRLMKKGPVCTLCGKKFPSMKSLFGHMRCHPEREWRGIQPPLEQLVENNNNLLSSLSDDDDGVGGGDDGHDDVPVIDSLKSMPKWGVKARRGRKDIRKSSLDAAYSSGVLVSEEEEEDDVEEEDEEDEDEDEEGEEIRNAVNDLMSLKQVDCSESSGVSTLAVVAAVAQKSRDMNLVLDQHQEVSYSNSLTVNNKGEEFGNIRYQAGGFEQVSMEMKRSFGKVDDEYDDHLVMGKLGMEEGGFNDHVGKKFSDHYMAQEANVSAHVMENLDVDDESDNRSTELLLMNNGGHKYFDWINHKDYNVEMVTGSSKNKKVKKMKLMLDLDQEKPSAAGGSVQAVISTTTEKYRCSTCNKCFSSHQALGGHRSSHNKSKITIINADAGTNNHPRQSSSVSAFAVSDHHRVGNEEFDQNHHQLITSPDQVNRVISEECATIKDSTNEGAGSSKGDHSSSTIHQCELCNKIFPSGQALGGHKRCHWTASADQTESQPQAQAPLGVTSSGEEASTKTGGTHIKTMGIDLNFPPPMDDDVEAQDGAAADIEHATRLFL